MIFIPYWLLILIQSVLICFVFLYFQIIQKSSEKVSWNCIDLSEHVEFAICTSAFKKGVTVKNQKMNSKKNLSPSRVVKSVVYN